MTDLYCSGLIHTGQDPFTLVRTHSHLTLYSLYIVHQSLRHLLTQNICSFWQDPRIFPLVILDNHLIWALDSLSTQSSALNTRWLPSDANIFNFYSTVHAVGSVGAIYLIWSSLTIIFFWLWIQSPPHLWTWIPAHFHKIPGSFPLVILDHHSLWASGSVSIPSSKLTTCSLSIRFQDIFPRSLLTIIFFRLWIQRSPNLQSSTPDHFHKIPGSLHWVILDYHLLAL